MRDRLVARQADLTLKVLGGFDPAREGRIARLASLARHATTPFTGTCSATAAASAAAWRRCADRAARMIAA